MSDDKAFSEVLSERPQTPQEFSIFIGDQLSADVEAWETSERSSETLGVVNMTRNGVSFEICVREVQRDE